MNSNLITMKKKLQRAIKNLQKSSKKNPLSNFSFKDLESGNNFRAKVSFIDNKPSIIIDRIHGYEIEELRLNLEESLNSLWQSSLPEAQVGSTVYLRRFSVVGTKTILRGDSYYYAIDSGIFDCRGEELGRDFKAICIGSGYRAKCSPTSEIAEYSIYKLLP